VKAIGNKLVAVLSGVAAVAIILIILAYTGSIPSIGPLQGGSVPNGQDSSPNTAPSESTSSVTRPKLVLMVLKGNEDNSEGIATYEANNTKSITLAEGQHIRFDSPDYRRPDSMRVIAIEPSGKIHILLKSYDVNNEFFMNVNKGPYELRVQARWLDSTYFYSFNVQVT
jgi:hypothetical protein